MSAINHNIYWILFDRFWRLFIAFATGVAVARLLAPELYGLLSFSNALVGVVSFLNMAAIEAVVVWALVREPEAKEEILGSAYMLRLIGGGATFVTVLMAIPFLGGQPPIVLLIAPIIAAASLFNAIEVGEYWLRQILASKYGVIARLIALTIGATGRIWAASNPDPLPLLALIVVLEALLAAFGLTLVLYRLNAAPWYWRGVWSRGRQLLHDAMPLLIAAAAVGVYARIGVLLLGYWHGAHEVGLFSVATIMAEATHAIPVAIMATISPLLLARRLQSTDEFDASFRIWLQRLTGLGLLVCLVLFFAAPMVLSTLFGERYAESVEIFQILIWSAFFVFVSTASEAWLIGHNLQRYQLPKTFLAATASLILNFGLTPVLGAKGTAVATLVSYAVSALLANALFRETRPLFVLQATTLFSFISHPLRRKHP